MPKLMRQSIKLLTLMTLALLLVLAMACGAPAASTENAAVPAATEPQALPAATTVQQQAAQETGTSQQPSQATAASEQPAASTTELEQASASATDDVERPTLTAGVIWLDSPLDPVEGAWAASQGGMAENLFRLSAADLSPEPWLATEAVQIDPMTWQIELRSGVRFHNRAVMDADAVKASLERTIRLSPGTGERLAIASMEVKDSHTVVINTTDARPTLPGLLTTSQTAIVDAAAADAAGEDNFLSAGALTGPYIPTEYIHKERLSSVANDDYWGGKPPLAGIENIAIPDTNSRELALQAGDIDFAINISPEGVERFDTVPDLHSRTAGAGTSVVMWWVNFERGTLSDPLVRQAVSHAIDRESIAGLVAPAGTGSFADLLLPEAMASCPGVAGPEYDPQRAGELLAQAGYIDTDGDGYVDKDGQALEIVIGGYPQRFQLPIMAEAAQAMLGEAGIRAEVQITEWSVVKEPTWDLFGWYNNVVDAGDPVLNVSKFVGLHADASDSGANNYGHYSNPELVGIIAQAGDVSDIQQRKQIACEALAVVAEESALLPVAHAYMMYGVNERVSGFEPHPHRLYMFDDRIGLSE
ncbi:MAG: ABC transporter substrate-binding protein [Chloroflexi bacterium]|nr:ABC transporter substrate-binding protein [Chloroflexota bacterium]